MQLNPLHRFLKTSVFQVKNRKKKKAKKAEDEATVNAYKRKKIDTTDDKSIDVYAEEEPVETELEADTEESVEDENKEE